MPALDTLAVHAGSPRVLGAIAHPIFQSATFASEEVIYGRYSNTPTHAHLHAKLAAIQGAEAALVTASGMAAISAVLLTHVRPGDRILAPPALYGGTLGLLARELARLDVAVDELPLEAADTWPSRVRDRTRLVYVESLSNPLLVPTDLVAVATFAREHGLVSVVDNTFLSPVNCRPLGLGIDLEIHSATKYLNGHSDLVAGCVAGTAAHVGLVAATARHLGGSLDAHACFLLERGLKTLGLRVRAQNATAARLAAALARHAAVGRVHYPTDSSAPPALRPHVSGWGGVLAFELARPERVDAVLAALRLLTVAPSLGGVETLVTLPARTSHAGLSPEARRAMGISDGLVRVAVGVEDADDLLADLTTALGHA
jgi:cystathionine gamma-synthase/cystathionine gamma-lyase/cystathionine beta-lyase